MIRRDDILGLSITLEVGEQVLLYLFLDRSGRIERMGDGEHKPGRPDLTLRSGHTDEGQFETLLGYVSDEMLASPGRYDLPDMAGEPCRLRLLFQLSDQRTGGLEFDYGSESEGPPSEVHDLVIAALDLTEPWYGRQSPQQP